MQKIMWKQWVNAILGLLVLAVPFLNLTTTGFTWTLAIAGIVVAVLAVWTATETSSVTRSNYASSGNR
jgi:hypothetical protein